MDSRARFAQRRGAALMAALGLLAGLSAFTAKPALATTCSPAGGQVVVWNLPDYGGACQSFGFGVVGASPLDVRSVDVGGGVSKYKAYGTNGTYTFYPIFRWCSGTNFTGLCDSTLFTIHDTHFDGASLKVQPYRDTNYFPTAWEDPLYVDASGHTWKTRTCTWGAARMLFDNYGIYPAWGDNAKDWDTNAQSAHFVVNGVVAVSTIVVQNPLQADGKTPTAFWRYSGFTPGVGPKGQYMHGSTNPLGHVGWAIATAQDSSGNWWVHTIDTNFHPDDPDAWGRTTDPDGNTWVKEWIKVAPGISFIHPGPYN